MISERFEQPLAAPQELAALSGETLGRLQQSDLKTLPSADTHAANQLLGTVDLVENATTASDSQLAKQDRAREGHLTTEQIRRMLDSGAQDISRNRINDDLRQLVRRAAVAGPEAMSTLLGSLNRRLVNMHSEYRLTAAVAYSQQGELRGGVVFIVRDGRLTGQSIEMRGTAAPNF